MPKDRRKDKRKITRIKDIPSPESRCQESPESHRSPGSVALPEPYSQALQRFAQRSVC